MAKRASITKKTRFEVFKRDSFTCQYCGKSSPDVVLEIDHIKPVSKGGGHRVTNLLSSCFDCNRGKSDRELSDDTVVSKQINQLKLLNEKREQLKMISKWEDELMNMNDLEVEICDKKWKRLSSGYSFSTSFRSKIKKTIKDFSLNKVLEAIEISTTYLRYNDEEEDTPSEDSANQALRKVPGICYLRSLSEDEQKIYKKIGAIKIFIKKLSGNIAVWEVSRLIKAYLEVYDIKSLDQITFNCISANQWANSIKECLEEHNG